MSLAALTALITASVPAQEPSAAPASRKPAATTAQRSFDPARRVPTYFGQVGLTPQQRESVYQVQAKEMKRIDELQKQIVEIRADMVKQCEALLSPTQKQLLEQRRTASREARIAPVPTSATAPTPAKAADPGS
jgi:TolA-binding protein